MKQITIGLILAVLTVGAAYSQQGLMGPIHLGTWSKAIWAPFVYKGDADGIVDGLGDSGGGLGDGPGTGVGSGPGWASIGAAIGFEVWGSNRNETGGFEIKTLVNSSGGGIYAYLANVWVKPFSPLLMRFGTYRFDDYRGKITAIGLTEITGGYTGDEDTIFQRCEANEFGALFVAAAPETAPRFIRPLRAFTSFGVTGEIDFASGDFAALTPHGLAYIFTAPHAGFGYDLADVGFLRAQYIGSNYKWGHGDDWYHNGTFWYPSHVRESARVEAAFYLSAVKNLRLDVGVGIPFGVTVMKNDTGTIQGVGPTLKELGESTGTRLDNRIAATEGDMYRPPVIITAAAEYAFSERIRLLSRLKFSFGERVIFYSGQDDFAGGFDFEAGLEPSYQFSFGTVALNAAIKVNGNDTYSESETISHNGTIDFGLAAWYTKDFGSGVALKAGVAANLPVLGDGYYWTHNGTKTQKKERETYRRTKMIVTIPLILTVSLY